VALLLRHCDNPWLLLLMVPMPPWPLWQDVFRGLWNPLATVAAAAAAAAADCLLLALEECRRCCDHVRCGSDSGDGSTTAHVRCLGRCRRRFHSVVSVDASTTTT
jgi:hypothetical protein